MSPMVSDHFYLFTAWANFSREVQARLQTVQSPQDIVAIAAEKGYNISTEQLSHFSQRLRESYWVWNQKDDEWRHAFFGNPQPSQDGVRSEQPA